MTMGTPDPVSVERDPGGGASGATVMDMIRDQARCAPAALALLAPGRPPLSFGSLVGEVDRTVQLLAAAGLGQGSRIAVALPNGPELAVALLAVTDCATCAPLNPATDEATSRYLVNGMRIDALIVGVGDDSPVSHVARALGVQILRLSFSPTDCAGTFTLHTQSARGVVVAQHPTPRTVSLLLHTSGTTAKPKLVPLTCGHLSASASSRARLLQLTSADRCLCVTPMFTSSGVKRNLFPTMCAGAGMICTPGFDADAFIGWLDEFEPTFYTGNPAVHRAVLDLLDRCGAPSHRLRFALSTSAPLAPEIHQRFEAALGAPLIQAYAMTEGGAIAQSPLPPGQRRAGSVGLPAGAEVAVQDVAGARLGPGEVGEIVVRGGEVFEGYENDPEANAHAFREGWFRTGDIGYVDEDGFLFLSGRVKDLINRGGFKVSPFEVDTVLLSHPDVLEAATFGVAHPTLGEDVVAAVVLRRAASVTAQELRECAMLQLSAFKVPSRMLVVESIPKTVLGKFRRREFAEVFAGLLRTDYAPPSGMYQEMVAGIFAEVLGLERVGAHDNFFELGGDSLRGAQVVARVKASLSLDVSPVSLFMHPTVAQFAAELEANRNQPRVAPPILPLQRIDRDVGAAE